jgi:hypothetical protein
MKRTLGPKRTLATVVKTEIARSCLHLLAARDAARRDGNAELAGAINEALLRLTNAAADAGQNRHTVH